MIAFLKAFMTGTKKQRMPNIVVAYHSGYGNTAARNLGAPVAGARWCLVDQHGLRRAQPPPGGVPVSPGYNTGIQASPGHHQTTPGLRLGSH
jgi:hypothetical protein